MKAEVQARLSAVLQLPPALPTGCRWLQGLQGPDDGTRRVNASPLAQRQMFCVEELLLGRKEGGEGPFFIILRCILICTSDVVSVMDDTEGKITAQEAQQRGEK